MKKTASLLLAMALTLSPAACGTAVYAAPDTSVLALQQKLQAAGYNVGTVDGVLGPRTEAAIRAFQTNMGLKVDGIAGPATLSALGTGNTAAGQQAAAGTASSIQPLTTGTASSIQPLTTGTVYTKVGMSGTDVTELQRRLQTAGFGVGTVDGIWGARTDSAIRAFQAAAGLKADGIVGPATLAALGMNSSSGNSSSGNSSSGTSQQGNQQQTASIQNGASGNTVFELQQKLLAAGYSFGGVDGIFGAKTEQALRSFQVNNGLPVTGIADSATLAALGGGSASGSAQQAASAGSTAGSSANAQLDGSVNSVMRLQQKLQAAGYYFGAVDGIFGSLTDMAIRAFQMQNGLQVDGIVGPSTLNALGL